MARSSVQLNLPPQEVEKLSRTRESAPPQAWEGSLPASGEKPSLTELLAESCEGCGLSEKDAALSQGYDPKYWPRIKSGEKAAHLERIGRLPVTVQREFVARWARQLHMDVRTEDARTKAIADLVECAARALREIA